MAKSPKSLPFVIFCEDDCEDWILISDVLEEECKQKLRYEWVQDGEELMERLHNPSKPLPNTILLDLKMPRMNGSEALAAIRADERLKHIPVIMLTTSRLEADIFDAYHKGANSYLVKPVTFPAMTNILKSAYNYWSDVATIPDPSAVRA